MAWLHVGKHFFSVKSVVVAISWVAVLFSHTLVSAWYCRQLGTSSSLSAIDLP